MNRILVIVLLIVSVNIYAQNQEVNLGKFTFVYNGFNGYQVSLNLEKPNNKLHLIEIDTISVIDDKGRIFKEVSRYFKDYSTGNFMLRHYENKEKFKYVNINGVIEYFQPSKEKSSHIYLGRYKELKTGENLIPENILTKESSLYFGLVDIDDMKKLLPPSLTFDGEPIDFSKIALVYAIRFSKNKKIIGVFNNEIAPNPFKSKITITNKENGITYYLCHRFDFNQIYDTNKINNIKIELMIENEESISKIPFEFKKILVEEF